MTHSSRRALLENLRNSTKSFLTKLPCPLPSTPNTLTVIPPLSLTKRTSQFRQDILKSGLLPQICALTLSKAHELEKVYCTSFEQACGRLEGLPRRPSSLEDIFRNVRSTFETLYDRNLNQLLNQAKSAKRTHQSSNRTCGGESKSRLAFRHEYSSVLERYFHFNAYPSSADRTALARKTQMSCRQIEVWNHRSRAKKDGKELRRSTDTLVLQRAIDTLNDEHDASERHGEIEDEYSEVDDVDDVCNFQESQHHNFTCSAPAHAFPTRYPPRNVDDPFPCTNGIFNFAPVQWARKPASSPPCHANPGIDDLAAMFSLKLNIRQGPRHAKPKKVCGDRRQPWFSSLVTAVQVAPHPALLRKPNRSLTQSPWEERSTIRSSPPSSLYERICKAPQLPRRIPAHPPVAFGDVSFVSQSPVYDPPSKRQVLSQSRFSSSSSLSSIEPSTPPLSPLMGPLSIISTEQDCPILDNLFPNICNYISRFPPNFGTFLKPPPLCDDLILLDKFSFVDSLTPQYSITT